jgi:putative AbiEii toxin of type IV toxin-antitoxin system
MATGDLPLPRRENFGENDAVLYEVRRQMAKAANNRRPQVSEPAAIAEIQVAGFKSISDEQSVEIRPLTILAGANSSGKSSMMQPLLLLKQTLEASYDPGPLLLNGPNVKFTAAEQLLSRTGKRHSSDIFQVGMRLSSGDSFQTIFRKEHKMGFRIEQMGISAARGSFSFVPEMTEAQIVKTGVTKGVENFSQEMPEGHRQGHWKIERDRCFLEPLWVAKGPEGTEFFAGGRPGAAWEVVIPTKVIHLPGLRSNPERTYPVASIGGPAYPGTFDKYTASFVSQWATEKEDRLAELNADLQSLRLAGGVTAVRPNAVQIELLVGRLPDTLPTSPEDQVNIADVGVGVSQTLPVLVALHAAKPGTLVYVEQPETHLHPRAQFALAQVLAAAAERGVRVVIETHSSTLLLGVQTLVAEGKLAADKVKLHWFERGKDGRTTVRSGDLDEAGAFGDWPEDFDDEMLKVQQRYLDAASKRILAR